MNTSSSKFEKKRITKANMSIIDFRIACVVNKEKRIKESTKPNMYCYSRWLAYLHEERHMWHIKVVYIHIYLYSGSQ